MHLPRKQQVSNPSSRLAGQSRCQEESCSPNNLPSLPSALNHSWGHALRPGLASSDTSSLTSSPWSRCALQFPAEILSALGDWRNNTGTVGSPTGQGAQEGTQWCPRRCPKRGCLEQRGLQARKSTTGMWDVDHAIVEQNMVRFAFLSVSLPHQMMQSAASSCARHPAQDHHQFSASPSKPGTYNKSSKKASFHPLPNTWSLLHHHQQDKGSHHRSEPERWRTGTATHRLWAASWPCSVAPAGSSASLGLPLSFPPLVLLPASTSSACQPHPLFLHPSSEQFPTTQAPLARYQGHGCVLKAALDVTYKTKIVAE